MFAAAAGLRKAVTEATQAKMQDVLKNLKTNVEEQLRQEVMRSIVQSHKESQQSPSSATKPVKVDASKDDFDAFHKEEEDRAELMTMGAVCIYRQTSEGQMPAA